MSKDKVSCLYCHTVQEFDDLNSEANCSKCGMPLSKNDPEGTSARRRRWLPFFWFVVIFCVIMILYLPR